VVLVALVRDTHHQPLQVATVTTLYFLPLLQPLVAAVVVVVELQNLVDQVAAV
jgi:hypothetical protein